MTLKELLKKDRSYRGYDESVKVTREQLMDLVDHARYTASTMNQQPLKYYLAYEPDKVAIVQENTIWARALSELHLPFKGHYPPAFIIVCQDLHINDSIPKFQTDVGIVSQVMLMAATEKGLGGCIIESINAGAIKKGLNLPENIAPLVAVAVGKPDETIVLTEIDADGSIKYYRDENNVHYVPKRKLEDIIL